MKRIFGTSAPAPSMATTLAKLRDQQALIEKREEHLKRKADDCTIKARAATQVGNKAGALLELKRRKQYTSQLEHLEGLSLNLMVQITEIEKALFNKEQVAVMEEGVRALKSAQGSMTVEKVERLTDELQDTLQAATEIQTALSRPLVDVDPDEFEDELMELTMTTLPPEPAPQFPSVPTHVPVSEEEQEMEELRASMAM